MEVTHLFINHKLYGKKKLFVARDETFACGSVICTLWLCCRSDCLGPQKLGGADQDVGYYIFRAGLSGEKDLDLSEVASRISSNGYKVVNDPETAHYLLQANVLYVGVAKQAAIEETLRGGYGDYGGLVAGAAAGSALSRSGSRGRGAVYGGLAGAAAEMIASSLVKNVTYTIITDVQVSEKSSTPVKQQTISNLKQGGGTGTTKVMQQSDEVSNWRRYRTRIASTANKVNLKFEEAEPVIVNGLVRSLSGLL